ncbi:hypothetical protein PC5_00092 [Campylobacter phage PC5]|uniref:Uncharacterized protein n=1 Tax=Campylobacter phage PC5 TaxID=1541690 RepID=A0A1B0XVP5_9CAUD|nr:hypothetical protein PC5_00092 [Campylobacter phage PC5]
MELFKKLEKWLKERHLDIKEYDHLTLLGYLHEEIDEGIKKRDSEHESIDWRCDCIVFLINSLYQDGYNPKICMDECLKEIEERTGEYSESERKFKKHMGAYTYEEALDEVVKNYNCRKEDITLDGDHREFWYFLVNGKQIKIKKWYKADYSKSIRDDISNERHITKAYKLGKKIMFKQLDTNNKWQLLKDGNLNFKEFDYKIVD